MKLGLSGHLTRATLKNPLTPLMALAALALGLLALVALPREEEPQISVPMVDILVRADGLAADDAVELVTRPLETIVKGIDGVEHVYSQTVDDQAMVTARFFVGTDRDAAILRVHETIRAHMSEIPIGIPEPLIVGRSINDVPVLVLALSAGPGTEDRWTDNALYTLAEQIQHELIKVDDVGLTFIAGGHPDQIRVEPDPERLSLYGVPLNTLVDKVRNANRAFALGSVREGGGQPGVEAGQTLQGIGDIGSLLLTTADGRPVYVKDVARVVVGASLGQYRVWQIDKAPGGIAVRPAVSIALAKRKGANAVAVADGILRRLETLKGPLIPADVSIRIARNTGETAQEKSNELLFHLALATVSIVALVVLAVGWREGVVVAVVIPITILLTLFATFVMGYTVNRVSLFALIFSIGILVDDAIVVVENIARHWRMKDDRSPAEKVVAAVVEVGNPTVVATLTIVAALLPMLFVSGMMGPYMSPIPVNASAAMVFSFFVAMTLTPWLVLRLAGRRAGHAGAGHGRDALGDIYRRVAKPLLTGHRRARIFLFSVAGATLAACLLFVTGTVTVKLLPFDNKPEFQIQVDLPEGASLEDTERVLQAAARRMAVFPEVMDMQSYAGTAAPFNFNGLVRHSYLRGSPELGELQVNLTPKGSRSRSSHDLALAARRALSDLKLPTGSVLKVVEVPPGPPVMATLLAEVYGPDAATRRATAERVRRAFSKVPFVVDIDDSTGSAAPRLRIAVDQEALEYHGVEQQAVFDTLGALFGGVAVGYSHRGRGIHPIEIAVKLPTSALVADERILSTPVPGARGIVELGDVVRLVHEPSSRTVYRRDGRFTDMVTAELAGAFEAPIYGMMAVEKVLAADSATRNLRIAYHGQPVDESRPSLLWDGEWEVTYVTFRDMGLAFAMALVAIYGLVVAQFGSFLLPLVILVPVPLTLVGIILGHAAFGAPFSAPSMIGFIALAGIIVRNSILLVDFIRHLRAADPNLTLRDVLLEAGAIRFKPIVLTAAAAIIGAAFILADPIFQGLAISLVFGLLSSTVLTVLVIPAIYVWLRDDGRGFTRD